MDKRLTGKAIIITGGARGLGLAMAKGLAGAGASLMLADVDGDEMEKTLDVIKKVLIEMK